jgi:hypothetical protein
MKGFSSVEIYISSFILLNLIIITQLYKFIKWKYYNIIVVTNTREKNIYNRETNIIMLYCIKKFSLK